MPIGFEGDVYVGRRADLEQLAHLIRAAREGSGSLLLVSGEAGMGKTRFAEEAARLGRAAGLAVGWGQCTDSEGAPPYLPWTQALRQLNTVASPTGHLDWRKPLDEGASRFQLFEEALEAVRVASARNPVLVVLDDLQWADAASLHLLQYAASALPSMPAMVLANHRNPDEAGELASVLPNVERQRGVRRLQLRPLTADEGEELAGHALGPEADRAALHSIRQRAEGNPLFIRELANLLAEPGAATGELPKTVVEVIRGRLRTVDPALRRLLQEAAVLGVGFDPRLLVAVTDTPPDAVEDLMREAVRRRLLSGDRDGRHFTHGLICEVLYGELPAGDRARLHAEAARALQLKIPDLGDRRPEVVAHHLREAVSLLGPEPALAATLEAADDAESALAHEDFAAQLAHACELASMAGMPAPERRGLKLRLAGARFRAGAVDAAWEACREVAAAAREAGDWPAVADAATLVRGLRPFEIAGEVDRLCADALAALPAADLARRAKLLAQRVMVADLWALSRDPSLGTAALQAAEASGDPDARFMALQARWEELATPEHCLERLSAGDRALRLGADTNRPEYGIWGHFWRIGAFWELGRRAQLDAEVSALAAVVDRMREPPHRWRLQMIRAAILRMEGRFGDAAELLEEAVAIGRAVGYPEAEWIHRVARGHVSLETGGSEEIARDMARTGAAGAGRHFAKLWQALALTGSDQPDEVRHLWPTLVERFAVFPANAAWIDAASAMASVCCLVEDRGYGPSLYATLLPFADRQAIPSPVIGSRGPVALYLGNLAALLGDWTNAEAWLCKAIASAQAMVSPPYEAIARHALAAAWMRRGRPRDRAPAARENEQAAAIAARLGMRPLQAQTARLAGDLRRPDATGRLSARELEVAELVAQGLSNQAIARRLHLSSRTAENHVQHILAKLGFDSRSQIAAWVAAGKD